MIKWTCRQCSETLEAPAGMAGTHVDCPSCGTGSIVPHPEETQRNLRTGTILGVLVSLGTIAMLQFPRGDEPWWRPAETATTPMVVAFLLLHVYAISVLVLTPCLKTFGRSILFLCAGTTVLLIPVSGIGTSAAGLFWAVVIVAWPGLFIICWFLTNVFDGVAGRISVSIVSAAMCLLAIGLAIKFIGLDTANEAPQVSEVLTIILVLVGLIAGAATGVLRMLSAANAGKSSIPRWANWLSFVAVGLPILAMAVLGLFTRYASDWASETTYNALLVLSKAYILVVLLPYVLILHGLTVLKDKYSIR